jgi:hypothetical protein
VKKIASVVAAAVAAWLLVAATLASGVHHGVDVAQSSSGHLAITARSVTFRWYFLAPFVGLTGAALLLWRRSGTRMAAVGVVAGQAVGAAVLLVINLG